MSCGIKIGMLKSAERERDREMKWVSLSLGIARYLKLICVRERVLICMRERVRESGYEEWI